MKKILCMTTAIALLVGSASAIAQPRFDNHHPAPRHPDWRKGGHIARNDWGRGSRVDYRSRHLSKPPRGYEWRQVDGNYVLAGIATGLIASVILAGH